MSATELTAGPLRRSAWVATLAIIALPVALPVALAVGLPESRAADAQTLTAGLALSAPTAGLAVNESRASVHPPIGHGDHLRTQRDTQRPTQAPRVDALPVPHDRTPLDLEAIARGYSAQTDGRVTLGAATGPGLLVFVSLSMPRPSLERLLDQAARAHATVVLRGLVNGSLRNTVETVQPLLGARQGALQIDPQAFDRFDVQRVPSFVLVRDGVRPQSCASGTCAPASDFVRVAGDVTLDYALMHMRQTPPGFRRDVQVFLQRLYARDALGDTTPNGYGPSGGAGHAPRRDEPRH